MRRLIWFSVKLAVIVGFVLWFISRSGDAHFVWGGFKIDTSTAVVGLVIIAAAITIHLAYRLWRFFVNGPEMWRLRRRLSHAYRGHRILTEGLTAIAAGNAAHAGQGLEFCTQIL